MKVAVVGLSIALGITQMLSSCKPAPSKFDTVYSRVTPATLAAPQPLPTPQTTPTLTVTGAIGQTNEGDRIVMDLPMIESVGLVEYNAPDPFEDNAQNLFQGVLMRDLLALWQVSPEATMMRVTALDDYQVEVPIELLRNYPVLFALKQNGAYMDRSYRGPAMLVFPYNDYDFDFPLGDAYWAWQIEHIEIY
jgi:hypothetical protein